MVLLEMPVAGVVKGATDAKVLEDPGVDKIDGWLRVCNFRVGAHGEEA
jgi:hypothetical protein